MPCRNFLLDFNVYKELFRGVKGLITQIASRMACIRFFINYLSWSYGVINNPMPGEARTLFGLFYNKCD
jgi:hypothetical protein